MSYARITLAALAVATIAFSAPAEARHHPASQHNGRMIDAAAAPAYPITHYARTANAPRQPRHRRVAAERRHHRPHEASHATSRRSYGESGMATVRSANGGVAHVAALAVAKFQALIDRLEAEGAKVFYMGGWRPGRCSLGRQHPCGWALDVCQDYRGHVSGAKDCNLPKPAEFHQIVRSLGLYDGSVWCNGDYGHVQLKDSGGCNVAAHGSWGSGTVRLATMTGEMRTVSARRHHHRRQYAHRRTRYARR